MYSHTRSFRSVRTRNHARNLEIEKSLLNLVQPYFLKTYGKIASPIITRFLRSDLSQTTFLDLQKLLNTMLPDTSQKNDFEILTP